MSAVSVFIDDAGCGLTLSVKKQCSRPYYYSMSIEMDRGKFLRCFFILQCHFENVTFNFNALVPAAVGRFSSDKKILQYVTCPAAEGHSYRRAGEANGSNGHTVYRS